MYAETAADAKNWTENIRMLSLVLNYKKAIRRQAPGAPRPLNHPLGGDTNAAKVMSPSTSEEERQHNTMQRRPREKESEADQSRRITCNVGAESPTSVPELHPNSHTLGRLKSRLDESSATDFHDRLKQKPQRRSQNYPTKQVDLIKGSGKSRQRESLETSDDEIQPNAQAINTQTWPGKRVRLPHRSQAQHVDIPILPFLIHNNDVSDDFAKQKQFTPPPIANPHPKRYSYTETDHGREITLKIQSSSESQTSAQDSDCPPDIPPKRCILKVSLDSKNGPQTHFLPPLPDFVPPPPPNKQSGSSSPATNNESVLISSKQISQQDPIEGMTNQCSWEHIHKVIMKQIFLFVTCYNAMHYCKVNAAYNIVHIQVVVLQMSKEIKRLGVCQQDNSVCISFGELLEKTKGIIADLPGTLVAAKRNQVHKKIN